jgi:deazaflavin-dependent oxidoreductase (nitroreductase family)
LRDGRPEELNEAPTRGAGVRNFNSELVREFRAHKGVIDSSLLRDAGGPEGPAPCLILTMVGAKSLKPRMKPLGYVPYDEDGARKYIIVASKAGSDRHPQWYHNLVAHPHAIIEVGEDTWRVKATLTAGDTREKVFGVACKRIPAYAKYQKMTARELPVFLLEIMGPEFGPE